jgi:serine-type D-Ala-D-Ala carboxypeptidase/endopeptidase (penicillin-binding protein 4)
MASRPRIRPRSLGALFAVVALLGVVASCVAPDLADAQASPGTTAPVPKLHLNTPLLSARRVPDFMKARIADQKLDQTLAPLLAAAPPTSCLVISDHGRTVFQANGDTPVEPASTNKLLTATGVLAHLKPDDTLATTLVAPTPPKDGVVTGPVFLVGGGDAILTTPGYKQSLTETGQTVTEFSTLADRVKAAGITEIQGDIVGDDSRYDAERYIPSWPNRYRREDTVGPLSALIVNDGVTGYTAAPDATSKVRLPGDPPVLAADTLKTYLIDRGIKVSGAATSGQAPAGTTELARIETTVADEVTEMLSFSDNTTAELLNKELGLRVGGAGTTAAGLAVTRDQLKVLGVPTAGLVMNDGSGLDDGNRLTCDLLNGVLDKAGPDSVLASGLSIWGKRGTLRKRVRGTPLEGNILGKTGTLTNPPVVSLAGFEKTRAGATLTFSFVQNGAQADVGLQDKMAQALFDYPQAPDLAAVSPRPPSP